MRKTIAIAAFCVAATAAHADKHEVQVDCNQFAYFAGAVTSYRDAGAKLEKMLFVVRGQNPQMGPDEFRVFGDKARLVFVSRMTRDEARLHAYTRCVQRLGIYPRRKDS